MFQADAYMNSLTAMLRERFGKRLVYVGLQGSYLRGEATVDSDIDAMVVIDGLTPGDLAAYREMIAQLGDEEKSCGFICGRAELAGWNPLEICHLLHSTRDYHGRLGELLPPASEQDVRSFVKLSIGNLYHEIVHRYVHADAQKNRTKLPMTSKGRSSSSRTPIIWKRAFLRRPERSCWAWRAKRTGRFLRWPDGLERRRITRLSRNLNGCLRGARAG